MNKIMKLLKLVFNKGCQHSNLIKCEIDLFDKDGNHYAVHSVSKCEQCGVEWRGIALLNRMDVL